jgi:hypothetical protein
MQRDLQYSSVNGLRIPKALHLDSVFEIRLFQELTDQVPRFSLGNERGTITLAGAFAVKPHLRFCVLLQLYMLLYSTSTFVKYARGRFKSRKLVNLVLVSICV